MFPLSLHRVASANEKRTVVTTVIQSPGLEKRRMRSKFQFFFFKCLKNERHWMGAAGFSYVVTSVSFIPSALLFLSLVHAPSLWNTHLSPGHVCRMLFEMALAQSAA